MNLICKQNCCKLVAWDTNPLSTGAGELRGGAGTGGGFQRIRMGTSWMWMMPRASWPMQNRLPLRPTLPIYRCVLCLPVEHLCKTEYTAQASPAFDGRFVRHSVTQHKPALHMNLIMVMSCCGGYCAEHGLQQSEGQGGAGRVQLQHGPCHRVAGVKLRLM